MIPAPLIPSDDAVGSPALTIPDNNGSLIPDVDAPVISDADGSAIPETNAPVIPDADASAIADAAVSMISDADATPATGWHLDSKLGMYITQWPGVSPRYALRTRAVEDVLVTWIKPHPDQYVMRCMRCDPSRRGRCDLGQIVGVTPDDGTPARGSGVQAYDDDVLIPDEDSPATVDDVLVPDEDFPMTLRLLSMFGPLPGSCGRSHAVCPGFAHVDGPSQRQ